MKKNFLNSSVCILFLLSAHATGAQSVAINTDSTAAHASAIFDIKSTTKGMLIPRMTTAQRLAISNPAVGLQVFDMNTRTFWFFEGMSWTNILIPNNWWKLTGNAGTNPNIDFIGTTDNKQLRFGVNNYPAGYIDPSTRNIALGIGALPANLGKRMVAIGDSAMYMYNQASTSPMIYHDNVAIGDKALFSNILGAANTAVGASALYSNQSTANTAIGVSSLSANTTGSGNTALGAYSLMHNISGQYNTAMGPSSLASNTTGNDNIAIGYFALVYNTTGSQNTAIGGSALYSNISGVHNIAIGTSALHANTIGYDNTAIGWQSLYSNINGHSNTAHGKEALLNNNNGFDNTAIGRRSLYSNVSSSKNTACGEQALFNNTGQSNTAIGAEALYTNTSGMLNTAVGLTALYNNTGNFNTAIGAESEILASNSVAIGRGSWTNTNNLAILGSATTIYTGGYANWSNFSDGRFKTGVDENVKGLDFILRLRPVTYHMDVRSLYNFWGISPYGRNDSLITAEMRKATDESIRLKESIRSTGFIAQEVEQAAKESGYDFDGVMKPTHHKDHYRIAYAEFVVPLVKGMQEQQVIIKQQQEMLQEHTRLILQLQEEIKLLKEKKL